MQNIDKKTLVLLILLFLSIITNLFLLVDYTPQPKKVLNLKFNSDYSYTLASIDDDDSTAILVQYDENYKAQEYIVLDESYQQVIMTNNGILLINDKEGAFFESKNGKLNSKAEDVSVPENLITNDLQISAVDGLQLTKEIDVTRLNKKQQETLDVTGDYINILQSYPMEYNKGFLVNNKNYIPKDFDSLSLH